MKQGDGTGAFIVCVSTRQTHHTARSHLSFLLLSFFHLTHYFVQKQSL